MANTGHCAGQPCDIKSFITDPPTPEPYSNTSDLGRHDVFKFLYGDTLDCYCKLSFITFRTRMELICLLILSGEFRQFVASPGK
jgi:hypothetical protein